MLWDDDTVDLRPCCSEYGRCGKPIEINCNCEKCLDYRTFSATNGSEPAEALFEPGSMVATELSSAVVYVIDAAGTTLSVSLPGSERGNYLDRHEFDGTRTDSSTYVRYAMLSAPSEPMWYSGRSALMGIPLLQFFMNTVLQDTSSSSEISSVILKTPRVDLVSITGYGDGGCPGEGSCELLDVDGFSIPATANSDILNGVYVKRYESKTLYQSWIGYNVDSACSMLQKYPSSFTVDVGTAVDGFQKVELTTVHLDYCFQTCQSATHCGVSGSGVLLFDEVSLCRESKWSELECTILWRAIFYTTSQYVWFYSKSMK